MGEQETCPGWDLKAGEAAEEELEMARAWLYDQDLTMDYNGKELPPEWALCRYRALYKCQFGDTVDEAAQACLLAPFATLGGQACGHPDGHRAGLGPKVPLPSGPHQCRAHPGEAPPPAPRGGSLAGCTPGQTGGQGRDWPDFARGVAAMHYTIAHLVPGIQSGQP